MSPDEILTPAQLDLVRAIQSERPDLYLTGGAALSAFYLGHRYSKDIDLFTDRPESFDAFPELARTGASAIGAEVRVAQGDFPHFRVLLVREGEFLGVDLVVDTAPAIVTPRPVLEGIRVDAIEDILANKLVTVTSRVELRDFVDLYFIDRHGPTIVEALPWAMKKEPSLSRETIAHHLASAPWTGIMPKLIVPVAIDEMKDRLAAVARELARAAFPR